MNNQSPQIESADDDGTYKWKVLITVAMGSLMATMDFSIINIAFPSLTKTFHTTLPTVMWTTLAYILMSTSSLMVLGKIGDLIGRKKMYACGSFIFCVGLATCSLAGTIGQLIFFRIIQAIGAAMTLSAGTAIVVEAFPANERGKGLGLASIFVSLGFIIGPVLGGALLGWMNWQSIFFMRIPIGLMIFIMAITLLKDQIRVTGQIRLDLRGSFISSMMVFCFVFGLSRVNQFGLASPVVVALIGLSIIFLIIFIFVENRAKDPIVDLKLFKNSVFSGASWSLFLYFVAQPPFFLILPFYLIQGIRMHPSHVGLIMAVPAVFSMISGPISGRLSDRIGPAHLTTLGAIMLTITFALFLLFNLNTSHITIILILAFEGIAIGIFGPPNNSIMMGNVPKNRLGTASALIATLRQVGTSVGMALTGTLYAARWDAYKQELLFKDLTHIEAERAAIPPAFHDVMIVSIFLGVLVMLFCIYTWKKSETN
ncbi:MAG: MFS transporter [Deltaproteobacteria bacterium]|nr:MFS transporter [Deltaproteobacteria bacterium]